MGRAASNRKDKSRLNSTDENKRTKLALRDAKRGGSSDLSKLILVRL